MDDLQTNSTAFDGSGPGGPTMGSHPRYGGTVTAVASDEDSGGDNRTIYLFIIWVLLLALFVVVIYLVAVDRRKSNRKEQLRQQQHQDVLETVAVQTSMQCNWVATATILLGNWMGLALSIFSLVTCQFWDLENEIEMDAYLDDNNVNGRESINIYSLGLWSVDMSTSRPSDSRCFHADGLPFLDWAFKLARASSVISTVFGGICLLILFVCAMKPKFPDRIRYLVWPFLLATIFQLLTLSLFNSVYCKNDFEGGNNCSAGLGVITSMTAALYWMFGATAAALLPLSNNTRDTAMMHRIRREERI